MKKEYRQAVSKAVMCAVIVLMLIAPQHAMGQAATQGQVALNLASILGLTLPPGATQADAINALTALNIVPAGGWQATATANSGFIASLYTAVNAAFASGAIPATAGLGSASAAVAAAATASGIPSGTAVNAITGAGGNVGQATQGAAYGGTYVASTGTGTGTGGAGGGTAGGGGGGGGTSPSPSR